MSSNNNNNAPIDWSNEQVSKWLVSIDYAELVEKFKELGVDGTKLLTTTFPFECTNKKNFNHFLSSLKQESIQSIKSYKQKNPQIIQQQTAQSQQQNKKKDDVNNTPVSGGFQYVMSTPTPPTSQNKKLQNSNKNNNNNNNNKTNTETTYQNTYKNDIKDAEFMKQYTSLKDLHDHVKAKKLNSILEGIEQIKFIFKNIISKTNISSDFIEWIIDIFSNRLVLEKLSHSLQIQFYDMIMKSTLVSHKSNIIQYIQLNYQTLSIYEKLVKILQKQLELFDSDSVEYTSRLFDQIEESFTKVVPDIAAIQDRSIMDVSNFIKVEYNKYRAEYHVPKDYKSLSIIPEPGELKRKFNEGTIKPIKEKCYESPHEYLETHFRLIREDIINPFRDALQSFNDNKTSPNLYTNVRVIGITTSSFMLGYSFTFDYHHKIDWETYPKLLNGSLVALSCDNFQNITYMIVSEREEAGGVKRIGLSPYEPPFDNNSSGNNMVDNTGGMSFGFEYDGSNSGSYSSGNSSNNNKNSGKNKNKQQTSLKFNKEFFDNIYVMIESPSFFISYENILLSLQQIEEESLPFKETLVYCNNDETKTPPNYVMKSPIFDFTKVFKDKVTLEQGSKTPKDQVNILDEFPVELDTLDASQKNAIQQTLTSSLSLIQGPPGTGKSFIGNKIFHIIHNKLVNDYYTSSEKSPILVLSHTNHALDQFAVGLLGITKQLVRVGTRSKEAALKEYTMKNKMRQSKPLLEAYKKRADISKRLRDHLSQIIEPFSYCDFEQFEFQEGDYRGYFESEHIYNQWLDSISSEINLIKEEMSQDNEFCNAPTEQKNINLEVVTNEREDIEIDKSIVKKNLSERNQEIESQDNNKSNSKLNNNTFNNCLKLLEFNYSPSLQKRKSDLKKLSTFKNQQKQEIYKYWCKVKVEKTLEAIERLFEEYHIQNQNIKQYIFEDQRSLLQKDTQVIAATITGASKMKKLFESLKVKIVIIEECALTLEGQIVAILPSMVEQLILIGDHRQLKPICTDHTLLTKYKLNISIFERIYDNGGRCSTLTTQRRMVPSISQFIAPVYPNLENHSSVVIKEQMAIENGNGSLIRGLPFNVFFFDHSKQESQAQQPLINSKSNIFEAKLVLRFAIYLLDQNYEPEQITILTPYAGQILEFTKLIELHKTLNRDKLSRNQLDKLDRLLICSVDQYQGEENDIIIISLVRNNPSNEPGFLKITNRINVMLSRARLGLFLFGSRELLNQSREASGIWKNMFPLLEMNSQIGVRLPLVCENHRKSLTFIECESDISKFASDGGCKRECSQILDCCTHKCQKKCHPFNTEHTRVCNQPCSKILDCSHHCQLLCGEKCRCILLVDKVHPKCQHTIKTQCFKSITINDKCILPCSKVDPQNKNACIKLCFEPCEFVKSNKNGNKKNNSANSRNILPTVKQSSSLIGTSFQYEMGTSSSSSKNRKKKTINK